uniref:Uncharacterized protein AlNc14C432G11591 n=1 Tax=Albugo laibachii Nc14 TaxID=890382 RepID=F0WZK0_9STRA|nr:PREDICTED: hypothetical protein [Albugo laibachii Nc14]|eukprot:CCA26924.1 PREDICTED: hypothetical protein [Albugo laibachii Nc14]
MLKEKNEYAELCKNDMASVDTAVRENIKVGRESFKAATRKRPDLTKKDIRKTMVDRNQGKKIPAREIMSVMIEPDPKTYNQVMKSEKHAEWKDAADTELASLEKNNTWTIVPITDEIKALRAKWVFKQQTDADGNWERFEVRIDASGNDKCSESTTT